MALEIQSGLIFNSIIWLTSPRPDEVRMVETMIDDVSVICSARGIPFQRYVVPGGDQLIRTLAEIADAARKGCRPLIYLDMHGSATEGVEIAATNEMVAWETVVDGFREINRQTGNNLLVIAGVCFGFHAIKETIFTDHCPFFMLIAPEEKVNFGELMAQTFPFFQNLTTHWDVIKAIKEEMSPKMKTFHCMRFFTIAMAKYILRSCKGKGVQERREYLLTEVLKSGYPDTPDGRRELRRAIKDGIKPSQAMLDKYAANFLGGKPLGYDLGQLLNEIEKAVKTA